MWRTPCSRPDTVQIWIDAQISPAIAEWLRESLRIDARAAPELGLLDAPDHIIFERARIAGAAVLTKDADFLHLLERHGPPPQVVSLTCGNTSNARLRAVLANIWPRVAALLALNEALVEVAGQ